MSFIQLSAFSRKIKVTEEKVAYYGEFLMQNTSMVSLDGGSASKVDDVITSRAVQDGGYALPWQRYDNNKMAVIHNFKKKQ